jgi:hypothetical protein
MFLGFLHRRGITAEKIQFGISWFLRATLVVAVVYAVFQAQWFTLFVSTLALAATFFPAFLERNYRINLPPEFEFVIIVFVYATLFLGEVQRFYLKFWWWDIFLHSISGVALGFIGFLVFYTLYSERRIQASAFSVSVFSFSFALASGALWEIIEFAVDQTFGTNMQKSGLRDTMYDLIVDAAGAFATAAVGFIYLKRKRKRPQGLFRFLIERFLRENPKH